MSTIIYTGYFCNLCNLPAVFLSSKNRYWCSKNASSCPGVKELRKQKALLKYGVDNVSKSQIIKDAISAANTLLIDDAKTARKATVIERYGVDSVMKVQKFKDNLINTLTMRSQEDIALSTTLRKKTCLQKYGVEHITQCDDIRKATVLTNLEKYGSMAPMMNKDVQQRSKITCLEKYGVENPSQNIDVIITIRKRQFRSKNYVLPSGKQLKLQGYEPRAVDELLLKYAEDEIMLETDKIPRIKYIGIDGRDHYYFPDIFIPKENLIIEVKSVYTFNVDFDTVILKQKACVAAGFNYKFIIYK